MEPSQPKSSDFEQRNDVIARCAGFRPAHDAMPVVERRANECAFAQPVLFC